MSGDRRNMLVYYVVLSQITQEQDEGSRWPPRDMRNFRLYLCYCSHEIFTCVFMFTYLEQIQLILCVGNRSGDEWEILAPAVHGIPRCISRVAICKSDNWQRRIAKQAHHASMRARDHRPYGGQQTQPFGSYSPIRHRITRFCAGNT